MRLIKPFVIPVLLVSTLISCNNSDPKKEETKAVTDSTKTVVANKNAADSSKNTLQLTAQFVNFTLGDASHFMFRDESGKEWDFAANEDTAYKLAVELPKKLSNEKNQGWAPDKAMQGKWFRLSYIYRTEPQYPDGPMAKVAVITQVKPK